MQEVECVILGRPVPFVFCVQYSRGSETRSVCVYVCVCGRQNKLMQINQKVLCAWRQTPLILKTPFWDSFFPECYLISEKSNAYKWRHSLLYKTSPPGVERSQKTNITFCNKLTFHFLFTHFFLFPSLPFSPLFIFLCNTFVLSFHCPPSSLLFSSASCHPSFPPLQFVLVNSFNRRRMCSTDCGLGGHSCPITPWFINLLQLACMEMLFCPLALVVTYSSRGRLFIFLAARP